MLLFYSQLRTATEYTFRVRACSELTKLCGNWSANVTGTTSDGIASAPTNLQVNCKYDNISDRTVVSAQWEPPVNRNGMITSYHIELYGFASFRTGKNSILRNETYGPKVKTVNEKQLRAEYESIPFNTNYTIKVSAITRSKKPGAPANAFCSTPRSVPPMGSIFWGNFRTDDKYLIKLYMPELSERNGPICGYRIYLVRMPQSVGLDSKHLPSVNELNISTYYEVHAPNNTHGGAYIAETLSNDIFQNEIILGDGNSLKDNVNVAGFRNVPNEECRKLLNGYVSRRSSPVDSIGLVKVTTEDPLLDGKETRSIELIKYIFNSSAILLQMCQKWWTRMSRIVQERNENVVDAAKYLKTLFKLKIPKMGNQQLFFRELKKVFKLSVTTCLNEITLYSMDHWILPATILDSLK